MATKNILKKEPKKELKKTQKRGPKEYAKILKLAKSLNAEQIGELLIKVKEIQLAKIEPTLVELEEKVKTLKQLKAN